MIILRAGVYDLLHDFGSIRKVLCISLSVCQWGPDVSRVISVEHQGRSWLLRWVRSIKVGGRWCSCSKDVEGPQPDGHGCAVGPRIVGGSGNAGKFRGGGMMKKGGATGPSSQHCSLAFAMWNDAGLSTILHQAPVPLSLTRGCAGWLTQLLIRQGDGRSRGKRRGSRQL